MTSKGLFWIWLGPLAWMAILLLVASGRADGAVETEVAETRSEGGFRLVVDVAREQSLTIAHPGTDLLCASAGWTRSGLGYDR